MDPSGCQRREFQACTGHHWVSNSSARRLNMLNLLQWPNYRGSREFDRYVSTLVIVYRIPR